MPTFQDVPRTAKRLSEMRARMVETCRALSRVRASEPQSGESVTESLRFASIAVFRWQVWKGEQTRKGSKWTMF